ncbi:unnamed protein product [Spirodela intermedia]|uniref:Uncharacterized protein n=1 Tax=Spirodela intermedia TaxID=51605 RepID=A0A7I8KT68_SPIIN|nr:unnamed protein product [Spirodela intermedia]
MEYLPAPEKTHAAGKPSAAAAAAAAAAEQMKIVLLLTSSGSHLLAALLAGWEEADGDPCRWPGVSYNNVAGFAYSRVVVLTISAKNQCEFLGFSYLTADWPKIQHIPSITKKKIKSNSLPRMFDFGIDAFE